MPSAARPALLCAVLAGVLALAACSGGEDVRTSPAAAGGPTRAPSASPSPAGPSATGTPEASATPVPTASPIPTFLELPGPATSAPPAAPPAPGSLATVDWAAHPHPAGCTGPAGTGVTGDLDGDGVDELALPVTCGSRTAVHVYAGNASAPRLLGDALPAEESAAHYRSQVRDAHLVVTALRQPPGGEETALTTRWVVRSGELVRTDRWEDPAAVLEVDAH